MPQHDSLKTHEGRLAYIRQHRDAISPESLWPTLAEAKAAGEPHPVLWFVPEERGVRVFDRGVLLQFLERRERQPELWDLLKQPTHPPGTVFYFLAWSGGFSFLRSIIMPANAN